MKNKTTKTIVNHKKNKTSHYYLDKNFKIANSNTSNHQNKNEKIFSLNNKNQFQLDN